MFATARKKAKFTQKQVADALGVTESAISQWESGTSKPRASLLLQIAKLYNCTIDELLSGDAQA